jgi:hypothetical protein
MYPISHCISQKQTVSLCTPMLPAWTLNVAPDDNQNLVRSTSVAPVPIVLPCTFGMANVAE